MSNRGSNTNRRSSTSWRGRRNSHSRGGGFRGRGTGVQQSQEQGFSQRPSTPRPRQTVQQTIHPCPFKKWDIYFSDDAYIPGTALADKVKAFHGFFEQRIARFAKDDVENKRAVHVDYSEITQDPGILDSVPDIVDEIRSKPESCIKAMGLAIHQVFQDDQFEDNPQSFPVFFDVPFINVRLFNYEPRTPLKSLKANYYGKLVAVKGTVVRVSNVKPLATKMAFSCVSCNEIQAVKLPDGKYTMPTTCVAPECRGRSFTPQRSSPLTETIDWQNIRIQEIMTDDQREAGRIPRTVECEFTSDLVDSCVPGDLVTVTGIVDVTSSEEGFHRNNKDKCMFLLYIRANSVSNSKECKSNEEGGNHETDFSIKELYAIQEIHSEKNLFRLIVGSLCPAIYGHELVKAGLALALFGGNQRYTDDKNRIPVRGDPHVLVVGDPGLGKSQMLQAVSNVAPRGVYVCGNTTTTSGLTVTLCKESGSADYALEAGALVLADQGCCCIDEFDKMGNQHQALLEAMEQQSISIAKAGIVCSLPARTSILAAANPVGGHYNKAKTVSENLKMNSALLSRFDLVFILLDNPNEEMDNILSEHVMALHSGKKASIESTPSSSRRPSNDDGDNNQDESRQQWEADKPLSERLKVNRNDAFDPLPVQLLRKYISYARKYVHPKLATEAADVLQNFYLNLRKQYRGPNSTPVTTRQLESLIRLTEARARLELREKATARDAENVVEIMKCSLIDIFSDDLGSLSLERSVLGSGMSRRGQAKRFVSELTKIAERDYNSLFSVDQMRQIASTMKLQVGNFEDFILSLNNQNFLLKKGPRVYKLQTASCI